MSAIGPGDWVECVNMRSDASALGGQGRGWGSGERLPVEGLLYQVSDAWISEGNPVILVGWERHEAFSYWGERCGYSVKRFRPIYRPKADLIEALKTPAEREGVPA